MMFVFVSLLLCMGSFISGGLTSGLKEDANMTITKSCNDKERQTLLGFKENLVDINNTLNDWGDKDQMDCCQWVGVRCNEIGHVTELDLSTLPNGLSATVSPLLPLPSQLQYLDLSRIDFQLYPIPNSITSLTNLRYLKISAANLSGSIPVQLANLSSLYDLDLSNNFLSGRIPVSFGNFTSLTYLDLSGNRLEGVIPNFVASFINFSRCLSSKELILKQGSLYSSRGIYFPACPSLVMLDLSRNGFTGNLHKSMGKLLNLAYLDVSSNSLEGLISDDHFVNLTQLNYLDLSFNSFAINLSSHAMKRVKINTIQMQSCNLGPSFPMWIQSQRDFEHLDISNAGISDRIPGWFWDLPSRLRFLNLSSNEIKGTLPNMTAVFEGYPGMDLSYNQLEGTIPTLPSKLAAVNLSGNRFSGRLSFLCQIGAALTFLDLSNNLLTGSLPDCWQKFQETLVVLNLSNNTLSGEIPSSLGFLSQLQALYLRRNALVGELPMSLSNCTKLRFVDLGGNQFSGNMPAWIGARLSELYVLVLGSNKLNGSIPSQICLLNNLQFLDLYDNGFLGSIPRCFGNFTAMATRRFQDDILLHSYSSYVATPGATERKSGYMPYGARIPLCIRRNGGYVRCGSVEKSIFIDNALVAWKGAERNFGRGTLHLLKSIDISSNKLYGKLPNEITNLRELVSLNLSDNKLNGEVPKHMGRLRSLQSLDLSENKFSGNIPSSLSQLTFLSYLDVSYNNLSGRIPLGPQLQLFNSSSYTGNPQLCGAPLTQGCGLPPPPPPAIVVGKEDVEDGDVFWKSYYMGMGAGFVAGFWGVFGVVFLNRRCRYFFFASLNNMMDWIYVAVVVHFRNLRRKLRR